ncbi:MAG: Sulfate adenylyltransferase subunit 1 [bacterium ADurb.Bin429]|nr:MAG: Sulfate adenylyltransferase subunit 1 [bacterium ADurb.Bin429]
MTTTTGEFFKVVIVGHVDHGKSTLIGRLLHDTGTIPPDKLETIRQACADAGQPFEYAYITDQIREERLQGITLDTTQIFFRSARRDYVIIDAPGHREFLKHMITGASQAEGAMLVIDAREGVREQTRRHACLLAFLGLRAPVIVVNKMDLMDFHEDAYIAICREITELFSTLDLTAAAPIPIAAATGDNVAAPSDHLRWYAGPTLLEALDTLPKPAPLTDAPLRLPVQDIYHVNGMRIAIGQLASGRIADGDCLRLLPGEGEVTVTSLHEFGRERHAAECGENVGLALAGDVAVRRGQVIAARDAVLPTVTREVYGALCWLADAPLEREEPLTFRCATQEAPCRVTRIAQRMDSASLLFCEEDAPQLYETEIGQVVIATERPVIIESFARTPALGRFVLERRGTIVAGGVVIC